MRKEKIISQRKRKLFFRKLKFIFLSFAFFCLFIGFYWFIFYSPFFAISKINIISKEGGSLIISEQEILEEIKNQNKKYTFNYFGSSQSLVFFSEKKLEEKLKANHPEIESLNIKLNLQKNQLEITYQEREEKFNLCNEESCFLIDQKGIPFLKIEKINSNLETIYLKETKEIPLGKPIISEEHLKKLEEIITLFKENPNLIKLDHFLLDQKDASDFQIVAEKKMRILLNFNDDFKEIFLILKKLKEEKFKGSFEGIDYIDLRYLPKVYYKNFE
ncbi:MAG: cell division protein FtsQ/DivIB [Minisyncoccia bacterium]